MSWLLGGLALLLLLALLLWGFATATVTQVKRTGAVLLALVGFVAFALLLRSGRLLQALPALLPMLPLGLRLWRGWRSARRFAAPGGDAQETQVETATLAMRLDLGSGRLSGRVRQGRWAGRELGELLLEDLLALRTDCATNDPESLPLLETWLERAHPGWRAAASAAGGEMDRAGALAALGLQEGASVAQIRAAHRRLMQSAHPDHGGSAEQAARLNRARDILLR
ncbi:molecular chaperone DnaJ [Roseomonas sp. M0104]|uniref:Molecular chaperone DnaJ n=1 Tax=Teichococcus coralli TaxID=2545983 RepID=A0A845B8V7_9PROT|nr:molecular chaperone DnaJ [Pseudoroseomonas coralli]MXP63611.1 molecular chaperone DnaJ [Pseudoroseomonas coralli]